MTDPDREGFMRRQREAAERVRQLSLNGRGDPKVVPLRPAPARRPMPLTAPVLWGAAVVILATVYLVERFL